MKPRCSVCRREDREAIDRELAAGISARKVAWRFKAGRGAMTRHAAHLTRATDPTAAQTLRAIAEAADELARLAKEALLALQGSPGRAGTAPQALPPASTAPGPAQPQPESLPAVLEDPMVSPDSVPSQVKELERRGFARLNRQTHPLFFQVLKAVQGRSRAVS